MKNDSARLPTSSGVLAQPQRGDSEGAVEDVDGDAAYNGGDSSSGMMKRMPCGVFNACGSKGSRRVGECCHDMAAAVWRGTRRGGVVI